MVRTLFSVHNIPPLGIMSDICGDAAELPVATWYWWLLLIA